MLRIRAIDSRQRGRVFRFPHRSSDMANQRSRSACDRRSTVPRRALRPDVLPFVLVLAASCVAPRPTNAPPAAASEAAVVRNSEVRAIASRPDTAVASDSVARVVPIEGGYNVGVAVVRRQRVGDKTPPDALSHHDITEVYHIIHGAGVFVSGGVIIGGREMPADSRGVRRVVGPSIRGMGIEGGVAVEVGPGDIIVVPPNTPHGFSRLVSTEIVYTVVRVDPQRRLPVVASTR
jgi:mannose-6-phosphate isomerase-like protein (cupin superfamily)